MLYRLGGQDVDDGCHDTRSDDSEAPVTVRLATLSVGAEGKDYVLCLHGKLSHKTTIRQPHYIVMYVHKLSIYYTSLCDVSDKLYYRSGFYL